MIKIILIKEHERLINENQRLHEYVTKLEAQVGSLGAEVNYLVSLKENLQVQMNALKFKDSKLKTPKKVKKSSPKKKSKSK